MVMLQILIKRMMDGHTLEVMAVISAYVDDVSMMDD